MNDPLSFMRHPSIPPVLGIPNTLPPHVIYKPNNQEINYKQNVIVRWLKPPTPPPSASIIIRGRFPEIFELFFIHIVHLEIQPPPIVQPPIIYRQSAPCPPTPPPIIVR